MKTIKLKKRTAYSLILAVFISLTPLSHAESTSWGLSYPTPGEVPRGNASQEFLAQYDSYFVDTSGEKVIYLTFDAGYENGYTASILDTLKKMDVPAAFFLVGTYIRDNEALVKRMVDEGHIVGNHTMTHPDMSNISTKDAFQNELSQTEEFYRGLTGEDMPMYYRPPRGIYSEANLKMAQELGYQTIFWSLAYVDWNVDSQPSHDEAFSKLLPRVHPGTILLLHSTSRTNAEILEELIVKYREMGYEFRSLDALAK